MSRFFRVILWWVCWAPALSALGYFSPLVHEERIDVSLPQIQLESKPVILGSEVLWTVRTGADGQPDTLRFIRGINYDLDGTRGIIVPKSFPEGTTLLTIRYAALPVDLIADFSYFTPDSLAQVGEGSISPRRTRSLLDKSTLSITGSKSVTLSLSPGEGVSIDQSLYLRASGELAPNMNLEAQITDSASPITPEGDSRELSSLDQMYIRLYGDPYEVAFGDLDYKISGTQFMNIDPKFEGLRAGWLGNPSVAGAVAVSKAKELTVEFDGSNGSQGPYYLRTSSSSSNLQIVAGTEDVYLDGVKMERGDDYTIDYDEGSITFKINHFITSNSHIRATFQYSDENYRKSLYIAEAGDKIGNRLQINARMMVQSDDKNNPLQTSFTADDKAALKAAGDHNAYGNGVTKVPTGQGDYMLDPGGWFVYVGPDSTGDYVLDFTEVGGVPAIA